MSTSLPTYEQATAKDPWHLIASYLSPTILCTLTRVNHDFHGKFSPFLWGSPARHFVTNIGPADPHARERVYGEGAADIASLAC